MVAEVPNTLQPDSEADCVAQHDPSYRPSRLMHIDSWLIATDRRDVDDVLDDHFELTRGSGYNGCHFTPVYRAILLIARCGPG